MKKNKTQNNNTKTIISRKYSLSLLIGFTILALLSSCISSPSTSTPKAISAQATIYYVDSSLGSDSNSGTQAQPWKTIQKCLNLVQPSDICQILVGTYNEALTIKISGTSSAPITLKCETFLACTINSGVARSLVTYSNMGYYVIDGFRFISTIPNTGNDPMLSSVNFGYNFWGDGDKFERGNDGFILRNCYVEGAVYFYGSDNLVEKCELNGRGVVPNGITERSQPSENNVFRNNVIHDYTVRGGWSLQMTDNTLWEGNTIYNITPDGTGIDCDGAGVAVHRCNVKNNLFYNINTHAAIILENTFDSTVEKNIIRDSGGGIHSINYNIENGDGFRSDKDYKGLMTNTIIRNNVMYKLSGAGMDCHAVKGNTAINNTIYNAAGYGAISMQSYGGFLCPDWTIKNNIVSQSPKTIFFVGNPPITIDNNFYDTFSVNVYDTGNKTFTQWQALGHDVNSKIGSPLFVNAAAGDFHLQPNSPSCTGGENGTYMGAFSCQ